MCWRFIFFSFFCLLFCCLFCVFLDPWCWSCKGFTICWICFNGTLIGVSSVKDSCLRDIGIPGSHRNVRWSLSRRPSSVGLYDVSSLGRLCRWMTLDIKGLLLACVCCVCCLCSSCFYALACLLQWCFVWSVPLRWCRCMSPTVVFLCSPFL